MTTQKNEAPGEPRAIHSLAACGTDNDTTATLHIKHGTNSYNVMLAGQRIASFLTQAEAEHFVGESWV